MIRVIRGKKAGCLQLEYCESFKLWMLTPDDLTKEGDTVELQSSK